MTDQNVVIFSHDVFRCGSHHAHVEILGQPFYRDILVETGDCLVYEILPNGDLATNPKIMSHKVWEFNDQYEYPGTRMNRYHLKVPMCVAKGMVNGELWYQVKFSSPDRTHLQPVFSSRDEADVQWALHLLSEYVTYGQQPGSAFRQFADHVDYRKRLQDTRLSKAYFAALIRDEIIQMSLISQEEPKTVVVPKQSGWRKWLSSWFQK